MLPWRPLFYFFTVFYSVWSTVLTLTKLVRGERYDGPNTSRVMGGEMGGEEAAAMNIEAEGSILLSTTVVNRTFVFQQLRQTVEQLRGAGAIR